MAGAGLLGYVGAWYLNMYLTQASLERQWERLASPTVAASKLAAPRIQALTRLQIPKIKLDAIVVEGVSGRQLAKGPGHLEETAIPGEAGNAVITGTATPSSATSSS